MKCNKNNPKSKSSSGLESQPPEEEENDSNQELLQNTAASVTDSPISNSPEGSESKQDVKLDENQSKIDHNNNYESNTDNNDRGNANGVTSTSTTPVNLGTKEIYPNNSNIEQTQNEPSLDGSFTPGNGQENSFLPLLPRDRLYTDPLLPSKNKSEHDFSCNNSKSCEGPLNTLKASDYNNNQANSTNLLNPNSNSNFNRFWSGSQSMRLPSPLPDEDKSKIGSGTQSLYNFPVGETDKGQKKNKGAFHGIVKHTKERDLFSWMFNKIKMREKQPKDSSEE
ncbi:hypothetical protein [Cardinium endosymbiont of Dermatophagoides farinae]|uniref:hypothetical protein n=1 Tax=Cardinium endosymbiont of Dermatophagoides farinae TaxID=2597823 RepID=UPI00118358C0|nr:hypothetical protein [Cardinium endosymbiont of Dermatophagoides farinae]TSJ80590.1 hypothetical protein FPG78_00640 [Cardinium endosymbiont of Dermatophagoides farinae]